jgi:steroid delta-isomerase-like uncharacterized protein
MSKKENLELVHKMYEEALNSHDIEAHDKFWTKDMIWHGPLEEYQGLEAFKNSLRSYFRAFPDYYAINVIEMADGNMVAATGYFTATHRDLIYGVPATGKKVKGWFSDFWRIENGLLAENWVQVDYLGILRQLGVNI